MSINPSSSSPGIGLRHTHSPQARYWVFCISTAAPWNPTKHLSIIMIFFKSLPATASLLLLLVIDPPPISAKLVPLAIQKIHHSAIHRTHNLAHDLRLAFGGALASRAAPAKASNRVVYCKPRKQGGGHNSGGGNTTSSVGTSRGTATSTKTTTIASPTTTSPPSSPWKVSASFVRSYLQAR